MILSSACTAVGQSSIRPDADLEARLQPLAERAMERGLIPGLQIAVVMQDGRAWTGAFGVADMETGRRVTDETRFYTASTSKALTALAAAQMDYRGELDLDATLDQAFPGGTRFHEDYDPTSVTVRDLLTHTHGLQQGAISIRVAFTGEYTNDQLLELLDQHPPLPSRDFRYSNFGYDLVGLLMSPDVTGGWKDVVDAAVMKPLGMTHTTSYRSRIPDESLAFPHDIGAEGMKRIRLAKDDPNLGPAGGHFTTASDMARLLYAELNNGRLDGGQAIPAAVIEQSQRAQVPQEREFLHYVRHEWAMGWDIGTYESDTVYHRPGAFAGYYSNVAFIPAHGFGVAVLANGGGAGLRVAETVVGAIYDELLGSEDVLARMDAGLDQLAERLPGQQARLAGMMAEMTFLEKPRRSIDAYTGTYEDAAWGTVEVVEVDGELEARWGMVVSRLRPRDLEGDLFFAQIFDSDDQVTFNFADEAAVAHSLRMRGSDFDFVRRD
ncbi:MAG: serine hydrolase [Gemmatimonadota bacterium]